MDNRQDCLTYEKKILIRSEQVDMTRKLRMSELFRLMEEASIAHTEKLGCTRDRTLDRGLLWIITRQQAEIEELPAYDEEITVRSWQGDMMHVFFPRFYEIERAGRVIVRGKALWMLIDEASRQMVMPEDYDIFIPGRPGSDDMMLAPVVIPSALRAGGEEADGADSPESAGAGGPGPAAAGADSPGSAAAGEPGTAADGADGPGSAAAGEPGTEAAGRIKSGLVIRQQLVTRFSQVDINGHMNNTRYFDIIDDALYTMSSAAGRSGSAAPECVPAYCPEDVWQKVPRLVRANYLSELRAGDRFTLSGYAGDGFALNGYAGEGAGSLHAGAPETLCFEGADAGVTAGTAKTLFFEGADAGKVKFRIAYDY